MRSIFLFFGCFLRRVHMNSGLHWALISAWSLSSICERKKRGHHNSLHWTSTGNFNERACFDGAMSFFQSSFYLAACWPWAFITHRYCCFHLTTVRSWAVSYSEKQPIIFRISEILGSFWELVDGTVLIEWHRDRTMEQKHKRTPCAFAIRRIQILLWSKGKHFIHPYVMALLLSFALRAPFSLAPLFMSLSFSSAQPLCHSHRRARERLLGNGWKPKSLGSLFPLPQPASTPTLWLTFISSQGKCLSPRANTTQRPFECIL